MKEFLEKSVPENYRGHALALYQMVPAIPQLPEMAPEKQRTDDE